MPELPEVETVRRTLEYQLGHPIIEDVQVFYQPLLANVSASEFRARLLGKRVDAYRRIGKYLIFEIEDVYLVSHLRMEGKYYVEAITQPYDAKHTHAILRFCDGRELRYHDTRKFGRMYIYTKAEALEKQKAFANVGYDVFDERVTPLYLYEQFHTRNIVLKQALLDQSVMAGVGNIYADEICFALQLHPETKIQRFTKKDFATLLYETRRILLGAIRSGGTTIRSYTSSLGVDGKFQLQLRVHAKKDAPCPTCGARIEKIVVATRGTYYCPHCQKRRKQKQNIKRIGLTGVMGAGKSSVIEILKQYKIPVIDCDKSNQKLLQKGALGYVQIQASFKEDIYDPEGNIDTKKMSDIIFSDPQKKLKLETILHPLIKADIEHQIRMLHNVTQVVVEVPLLFEVKWESFFDEIWVVTCDKDILLHRLQAYRGISYEEANRRLAHQMPQVEKVARGDVILYNDKDMAYLEAQIKKALWKREDVHVEK